jgi:hypothetical protein
MNVSDWVLVYAAKTADVQLADRVRREAAWVRAFKAGSPEAWRLQQLAWPDDKAVPNV